MSRETSKQATLERDRLIVQLYKDGKTVKEIKKIYSLTNVSNCFKNAGFKAREYEKPKSLFCKTHPDKPVHKYGRCIDCHRIFMRKYNSSRRVFKHKEPEPKVKEVYEPRELTLAEQRIRDKYRNITQFEIDKSISVRWYDLNITVQPKHL